MTLPAPGPTPLSAASAIPADAAAHPVVLFDGVCNLCNATVRFVVARDPAARFRFAPLQSAAGGSLLARSGLAPRGLDSVVLVDGGRAWQRSDAAIRIAAGLGGAWRLALAFLVVPRPLRDALYDFIARNRYRWFGRHDACPVPTPEQRARFLEER
jgi:predicted DCC family thiol-disulfide oxidoreductase YuxK